MTVTLKKNLKKTSFSNLHIFLRFFHNKCKKYFTFVLNILQSLYRFCQIMKKIKYINTRGGRAPFFGVMAVSKDKNIEKMALETCTLKLACTVLMKKYPSA